MDQETQNALNQIVEKIDAMIAKLDYLLDQEQARIDADRENVDQ